MNAKKIKSEKWNEKGFVAFFFAIELFSVEIYFKLIKRINYILFIQTNLVHLIQIE